MRPVASWLFGALTIALGSSPAQALATYVYRGSNYDTIRDDEPPAGSYDTSMRVTVSITLPAELGPDLVLESVTDQIVAATIDDGRRSLMDVLATFSTDASGAIVEWRVGTPWLGSPDFEGAITTIHVLDRPPGALPNADSATVWLGPYTADSAQVVDSPGTWVLVPEPATGLLLCLGLVGLGARGAGFRRAAPRPARTADSLGKKGIVFDALGERNDDTGHAGSKESAPYRERGLN